VLGNFAGRISREEQDMEPARQPCSQKNPTKCWCLPQRAETGKPSGIDSRHEQKVLAVAQRITKSPARMPRMWRKKTFHKVFLSPGQFFKKRRDFHWMTRIAMNEAFMLLRRRRGTPEDLRRALPTETNIFPKKFAISARRRGVLPAA